MAHISRSYYKAECNLFGRHNVLDATNNTTGLPLETNYYLFLTLSSLTLTKPNWRFKGIGYATSVGKCVITAFEITEDDETLGVVAIDYKGSSEKIKVRNERIDVKRSRGKGYYTEDPTKAELAIRKHFYRMAQDERLEKAFTLAVSAVNGEHRDKSWAYRDKRDRLLDQANKFAMANMDKYLEANPTYDARYETYQEARAQYKTISGVKEVLDNGKAVVVVLDGTQYIVKAGDETKTCTDEDLSFDLRKKIGLLKLVQDKQMISDVGCRVDSSTFVLLAEVKEQSDE